MQLHNLHLIVVGGATGGAGVALLMARAGARVTLFERVAQPRAVGAGIALAENGVAVLESVGLGPALASRAQSVGPAHIVDGSGRILFSPPEPRPAIMMVRRATLQDLLLDAVAAEPRIESHFGTEVIRAEPDGRVTAQGLEGEVHLSADLVIGADGVHSRVRTCGAFGARVSPPGIAYARSLAPEGLAQNEEAWTAAGLFGSFPVDGATYFYASAGSEACRAAVTAQDLNAFRKAWERVYAPSEALLGALESWDDLLINRVIRVECRRWFDGRLVLLGDAAHAMPPNLGQGANSALVDAAVLLDALRQAPDLNSALGAYEIRRKPAVQKVAVMAARLGMLAEITNPVGRPFRDHFIMPLANRLASPETNMTVLQESPDTLRNIGRS